MPVYDFHCLECDYVLENEYLSFSEFDAMKALGGLPCPNCPETMVIRPGRLAVKFGKVCDSRGKLYPGGKRERRQMMEARYAKRNQKLEKLPPDQREKMVKFMEKHNIRKTAPAGPEFV